MFGLGNNYLQFAINVIFIMHQIEIELLHKFGVKCNIC